MNADGECTMGHGSPARPTWTAILGGIGTGAYIVATIGIQPYQWNVVTYVATLQTGVPRRALTISFAVLLAITPVLCALAGSKRCWGRIVFADAIARLWPLMLSLPLAVAAWAQQGPIFPLSLLHLVGAGWAMERSFRGIVQQRSEAVTELPRQSAETRLLSRPGQHGAVASLAFLVVVLTVIHTLIQINFFEHFLLGHADMGHFAEELKNAIGGRGLRSDSFPNTRLGWHFTPLMYVLVPGYWLWPSPVFLMVCSALLVHCAAFPVYWLARRLTESTLVGWLFAVAWLLHPSISRLPYSGTYGFQWLYITLPLVIFWIGAGLQSRWRIFFPFLAILLLCRETTAATTLGFGLYLAFARRRWKSGMITAIVSSTYAALCVAWIIPHFAVSGDYERMQMFGSLGSSFTELFASAISQPAEFFGRFVRHESIMFLAVLLVTLALAPIRSWKLSLSALPALLLVLLLDNPQWLSVKFWYQVSVLPVWFVATVAVASPIVDGTPRIPTQTGHGQAAGYALSVLLCCAWGHYLLGFSPISKSYDLYAAESRLQSPDPAFAVVEKWRREIPRSATILATERLAAHFTDYRRIYTGKRPLPADYVMIDVQDRWDGSGLPQRMDHYRTDPTYRVLDTFGSIVLFERLVGMPVPQEE